ncbi:lipid A biosynthesis acyltransferase [Paenibacillus thalictri]|uniref:Lipid A biosynthesis acyltransferase n=2 Tax=Paenibacillus thalictri TaxID=2527873 RepID=A0A4Q9DXI1_9BACL|nr:lipid A biosynthesis acyltransferase [Paenibacillus thalictri]
MLPRPMMFGLCRAAAALLYLMAGKTVKSRICANMQDVMPDKNKRQLKAYCKNYISNVVMSLYEIMIDSSSLDTHPQNVFSVHGERHLEAALKLGRGVIVYTPHVGNFFYYYWYLAQKYRCLTVATGSSPELRPLYLKFQEMGCEGLDYDSTPPIELLRKLRKHLAGNGIVFILGDFYRPAFPRSTFFGRMTRMPEGAAMLSIEYGAPVVPFSGRRLNGEHHKLVFEQPLRLYELYDRSQRERASRHLSLFMEKVICRHPEQWFYWFNMDERWESSSETG